MFWVSFSTAFLQLVDNEHNNVYSIFKSLFLATIMPLGFYLANVCFTLKVKTFLFMFSLPWFWLHLMSYSVQCWLAWKSRKAFYPLTCAKAVRPGMLRTKQGWSRAEHCLSPGAAFWAPLCKLCACTLLCPVCPRDDSMEMDAGGLLGVERGRCCNTFHEGMPAQTSVLGVFGQCRYVVVLLPPWAFFSSPEKECIIHRRR